ncbi:MAG: hemolysin family protein [Terracidiphilus sp.]|nr:hemolysin family protein [Terracidiphilus sp.]
MTAAVALLILVLAAVVTLAAYMRRVYRDFGKILSREEQDNLDAWEELVEPRLGLERDHAALCSAILEQMAIAGVALVFGAVLFARGPQMIRSTAGETVQSILGVVLAVVLCGQLLPSMLFHRTQGRWVGALLWPIRLLLWIVTPVSVVVRIFLGMASLSEEPSGAEEEPAVDVEALIEAGEEEGILEESDSDLVRSAVEFGDTLVREVMTPRPEVFAVEATTTLAQFLELLKEHNYSRVPVYAGSLDQIVGIAFAHDLLQITDEEAKTRTVESVQRTAEFVPETKRGYELLREMQREKQHMRVVIDEYGGVAGVVTIEDLLEEIVGEIDDEHDEQAAGDAPVREATGACVVPGNFPVNGLEDLFGEAVELGEEYDATTLGGLVSEVEGRIPLAGEVVVLEKPGLRIEVVASTDRLVERLRVYPPAPKSEDE